MAWDALAQTKWSSKLLQALTDAHVFKLMTNQNYEDEIRHNATVKIFMASRPSTATYTRDSTTIAYQRLTPGEQNFVVDQRRYWAIKVDNLEKHIAFKSGEIWEEEISGGGWELADDVDDYIRDAMASSTPTANILDPRTLGLGLNANAYDLLVDMATTFKNNNIRGNSASLHVAVPPAFVGLLYKDDRFVSFNTDKARQTIRGEPVGVVQNITIHESNNVAVSSSTYTIQAAWKQAYTYGEQLDDMEYIDKFEDNFDQGARAQLVFGGKAVQPQGLVYCKVQFAA